MRPIISAFLFIFVSFVCAAQNDRALNGIVYGENGGPLTGATVHAVGTDLSAKTDTAGRFALSVPHFVEELRAECPGYHALVRRIDDTFMVFKMTLDEKYASVILRRYVEDTGDVDNVYVIRNGEKLMYSDLVKELEV